MGHKIFNSHPNTVLLLLRIKKVLILLTNTTHDGEPFPKKIYDNLHRIYTSLQYTAPEIIGNRNEEFGYECFKNDDILKKFGVDEQIRYIMQGKNL